MSASTDTVATDTDSLATVTNAVGAAPTARYGELGVSVEPTTGKPRKTSKKRDAGPAARNLKEQQRFADGRPVGARSLRFRLTAVIATAVTTAAFITWLGLQHAIGPTRTFPLLLLVAVVGSQLLSNGVTRPLREMASAALYMADGDYTRQVRSRRKDEVGHAAKAFNRMATDLAASDQARKELVANVSHELRTPVAALSAQLENMVDGVTHPTPAALEAALAQTERLTRLVTYLLDLSRVEAGASALHVSEIAVGDFLEEVATDLSMVEASKGLQYMVKVAPDHLTLNADVERLRQVVINLVTNAIRHSPIGGEVRLTAQTLEDRGRACVAIEISDDGPGIAPEDRERIFERFTSFASVERGFPARSTTGGTGIGLSIVKWAVQLHGGRVEVLDSDRGARIRLVIPNRTTPR
jgi:signal transduction histidine kinase